MSSHSHNFNRVSSTSARTRSCTGEYSQTTATHTCRHTLTSYITHHSFVTSKEESLFLQRKNPRKIAWTVVYRRVNKKGVTEEVAKKRSKKSVKHQRGIVGADLSAILAKRNQKPEVRAAQRCVWNTCGRGIFTRTRG